MSGTIRNATNGQRAKVSSSGRLWTYSSTETIEQTATEEGDAWNLNTGVISLTDASESAVMYVKNTSSIPFFISSIAVSIDTLDAPTARSLITLVRNPTGGTIISGASNAAMIQNRDFGSNKQFVGDVFKGAQGSTITGGNDVALFHSGSNQRLFATINFYLPQGTSTALKIDLNNANGGDVYAAIIGFYYDEGA